MLPAARTTSGSPPQVRGKLGGQSGAGKSHRITPAGAGKTCRLQQISKGRKDHPRRCGENLAKGMRSSSIAGSPPQVRGKRGDRRNSRCCSRITPAGAGKTQLFNAYRRSLLGSPPQVRGKHLRKHTGTYCGRITPAGAGKTG